MRTIYILLLSMFFCFAAEGLFAQSNTENCVTGDATATKITYKVNGKAVPMLRGNVSQNSTVEVTFTTTPGTKPTRFSLVSYNAPSAIYNEKIADQQTVFDYETIEVAPGTHTFEVSIPDNFFQVNFVKGCVIWKLGPQGTTNFYSRQNRLVEHAEGGNKKPCKNCEGDKKVNICHVPKGNPANAHTITISKNAVKAHIGRHGGDYYGECKTSSTPTVDVDINCSETKVTASVNIESIILLLDDSSTQKFQIGAKTATVKPNYQYEGYFVRGAFVQLTGGTTVTTINGATIKGDYYINTCFAIGENKPSGTASNTPSQCVTGDATAKNIIYKVNGKVVPSLKGNVKEGNYVEVTFTTAAGTKPTRFSLVSYNAVSANFTENNAEQQDVFDYESEEFGPGSHTIGVSVPNNYFQLNFVKGCVIWKFGPAGSNNYYNKQGRLIDEAGGGTKNCCKKCEENKKVTICHVPKGNPDNAHTITIAQSAAKAHIGRHGGDYYGECKSSGGNKNGSVSTEFTCTSVRVKAKDFKLTYVVLLFSDNTRQRFDNVTGFEGRFAGTGDNDGKIVSGVWIKTEQPGGDCTGCGDFFENTDCEDGNNGTAQVNITCSTATATADVNIQTITLLLDDSSTQTFNIGAEVANVSPENEFEGYFIRGAYVKLEGDNSELGEFYVNEGFADCEDERPPLPVDLIKFEANKLAPSIIKLEWATASETNNDYIAIEKTSDMESWKEVCRVPSAAPGGNSQHVHDYSCLDNHADEDGQNIVYYRPKQVDMNGTFEYHNTIRVRLMDAAYATEIQSVYPNPVADRLNIRYNTAENGTFNIRLISLDGRSLLQNQFVAKPGVQTLDLDLMEDKLKPGLYVLEIQTEGEVFRQKVYKQ